ncbi:vomeronasal secretory protein 1-like [Odocoileus virginianus]|uniref:Vomeronasal secretory protein 1-like n=1 Tax=Odocoileus virginianus TaxID=9874 RepID=A0ABM4IMC9_ODOVR
MADAELPHVQAGVSSSSTGCREGHPFFQNCRYTFVQRTRLTSSLGLTSALQARDSLSFQGPDVSGKWFITAFVENKALTGDRVSPVTFCALSDTHRKAPPGVGVHCAAARSGCGPRASPGWRGPQAPEQEAVSSRDRGYCYDVDFVLEKTSVSGTYTASRGKTHVDVEELPSKDHLLTYWEGPFEGGRFRGAKLLSRNPDVSPAALEAFKKYAQRKGLSPEDVFTPEQMESCEPASD